MFTGDNNSNEIAVEVTNGGEPVELTGAVTAYAIRTDGLTAVFTGTLSGNTASVILPESCFKAVGTLSIVIKVGTTTVGACTCYVYRTSTGTVVDPEHIVPTVEELVAEISNMRQATTDANTAAQNAATAASSAQQVSDNAYLVAQAAQTAAENARDQATTALAAAESAQSYAQSAAGQAASAANDADQASNLAYQLSTLLNSKLPNIVQGGEIRDNALYLLNGDGEVVAGPFSGIGGGGGGGGGGGNPNATLTFASASGTYNYYVAKGSRATIGLEWSSIEDGEPTGNGTLKLTIGNVVKYTRSVPQGTLTEDVTSYLQDGENTLVYQMTDAYGNLKVRTFTVNVMNLLITSTFDDSGEQHGGIYYTYTVYGEMDKVVHFIIDNVEYDAVSIPGSGRQRTEYISAQSHGSHRLTVYYTATLNGEQVTSNVLHYDLLCIEDGNDSVIITSSYTTSEVNQYSTINISYQVYNPQSQTSDVTISVNGTVVNTLTGVDRTRQIFSYRLDTPGATIVSIASGNTVKMFNINVVAISADVEAETEGLTLYLSSLGRSNNEANPGTWIYDPDGLDIEATFSGFSWVNDGWVLDNDGVTVMRVAGDARITIPYQPFATDKRTSGFTIEIDFASRDVRSYDAPIISCMSQGRGFELTSQSFSLRSEGSGISMQFKEDEHVRAAFVVEKRAKNRLIYCYINGILSGVTQYPELDNFAQSTPVNISIGSNLATVDIYTIRIYDNDLPMRQMEENWIADTPDGNKMLERFGRNNIRNASDEIVISKLPTDLPYMIISCAELPQYKGDKKTCTGTFVDPTNSSRNFTFTNCQIDVQGTSSQYYARKNYKMKFNSGFDMENGTNVSRYKIRDNSIAVKTFCMKADVASSEGANNVELVRAYEEACPYKTPAQVANSNVRQGIDGFPIVIFWEDPANNTISFLGKYNFNNDKSTEDVFGFVQGDESWEIRNNTSNRVVWKNDDFTGRAWLNDFEARYPDTDPAYEDPEQLATFAAWVRSTDPAQATGNALPEAVTYPSVVISYVEHTDDTTGEVTYEEVRQTVNVEYTTDTADYRKAKFRNELGNYCELQSTLFYYLFTELFLMVDSRAKNAFPSFIGTPIENENEES